MNNMKNESLVQISLIGEASDNQNTYRVLRLSYSDNYKYHEKDVLVVNNVGPKGDVSINTQVIEH